ncbi:palmitoyltransferase Akr1p [[Candida] jaroonii]|uniref:Palmitoyltransferase Akr1p n=1 Tax=[Candida] jaroonii TaxID=467808 RepID=A0ACA9Y321_9ASCO|nr:palmitoyltransferase Akr1p [[Candida] jaroonii]
MSESVELQSVDLQSVDKDIQSVESNVSLDSTQAVSEVTTDNLNSVKPPESINEEDLNPDLNSFMISCRQGNLITIKELLESKKININDTFSDGITGLHWASINNQREVVKYLIENGIEVDKKGGDLDSTALHWSCRNGLLDIVHLLLEKGANPTLFDNQHYNALQLSVLSSNILLIVFLLYKYCPGNETGYEFYVDEEDNWKRTSLHWACYQGDVLSVKLLIKFGANVNKSDESSFLPIHWAFTRAYKPILKYLINENTDLFHKNNMGKDTFGVSKDMDCYKLWIQSLNECGRFEANNWEPLNKSEDSKRKYEIASFQMPWLMVFTFLKFNTWNTGFAIPKFLFSIGVIFVLAYGLRELIVSEYVPDKAVMKSNVASGIFSGTLFLVTTYYFLNVFPMMIFTRYFLLNLILISLMGVIVYTFYKSMTLNPGFVPVPTDNHKIYKQIEELISENKFDDESFCVESFVRKPIRSRYSRQENKLIARFDHYCPWVYNNIGVRNHKIFMMFVYSLNLAIVIYSILCLKYFDKLEDLDGYESDYECILSDELCSGFTNANFGFNLIIWCWFQLTWVTLLSLTQTVQICKGLTTFEFSNLMRSTRQQAVTNPLTSNFCFKVLGIDQFFMTVKLSIYEFLKIQNNQDNYDSLVIPSDYGFIQNLKDFWFLGDIELRNIFYLPINGENNLNGEIVDYYTLYEFPTRVETV